MTPYLLISPLLAVLCAYAPAQGSIRGWGQEGFFDTESRNSPAVFVSANVTHTAVVLADGRLFVQGDNNGKGCEAPLAPAGLHYVDCQTGAQYGVARLSDGSLVLWSNPIAYFPQLALPTLPAGTTFVDYAVGVEHALFLRSDGVVESIGENVYGQRNVPNFPSGLSVVRLFAGAGTSAAILSDGSLWCWGNNNWGQCNVTPLPAGLTYVSVSLGYNSSLAIRSDGSMVAFGPSVFGLDTVPAVPAGVTWLVGSAGGAFHVGLRSDGVIEAWGDNTYGELNVPTLPPVPVVNLDAAALHTVALLADGRVIVWGLTSFFRGDLHELPGAFQGSPTVQYVDAAIGHAHCLALQSDGAVVAFGNNVYGQIDIPPLPSGMSYTKVLASFRRSAVLRSDGQLLMFGHSGIWSLVPPLPTGVQYVDAAMSEIHSVALRSDGQAIAFGDNSWGISTIPPLPPGRIYKAVDAHYARTLLLRSDDVLFSLGQLGNYQAPTVPIGVHFTGIAVSRNYDAALRSDGRAVLWGSVGAPGWGWRNPAPLPWGTFYVEVEGGDQWTALRRSDGQVVIAGQRAYDAPPLQPGTSYLQLTGYTAVAGGRVGLTSTYVGIGHGCQGTERPARIVPADTPKIGRTFAVNVFGLPVDVALLAMSFGVAPPATPLGFLGMPGCDWHIGLGSAVLLSGRYGVASHELVIPAVPGLVGQRFQHQALVLDPGSGNGFGAVVSDAMEGVIGYP